MDYREYNVTKVEEKVIGQHFEMFLSHNDVDTSGDSQPEMDFNFYMFKTAWIMARAYTD